VIQNYDYGGQPCERCLEHEAEIDRLGEEVHRLQTAPTCDTCKHWLKEGGFASNLGDCDYDFKGWNEYNATLGVGPKFGCVHHQKREKP